MFEIIEGKKLSSVKAIIFGSGRFIRSVLCPAIDGEVVILQPRGEEFTPYFYSQKGKYEIDIVNYDGSVSSEIISNVVASGSVGSNDNMQAFLTLVPQLASLSVIGVGVTEAGVKEGSEAMVKLETLLFSIFLSFPLKKISIINTDNINSNGDKISTFIKKISLAKGKEEKYIDWLNNNVCCHNSMVDRIVSQRDGNVNVPRTEPLPYKALVIEDLKKFLTDFKWKENRGVYIRSKEGEIEIDHSLKLRIANATHTALVYLLALDRQIDTKGCNTPLISGYLDSLYENDLACIAGEFNLKRKDVDQVYSSWKERLFHPHFGLSSFFVTQNASTKLAVRLLPSFICKGGFSSVFMCFSVAVMMRYLTPLQDVKDNKFIGVMDSNEVKEREKREEFVYADGLKVKMNENKYEFKDGNNEIPSLIFKALRDGNDIRETIQTIYYIVLNSGNVKSNIKNILHHKHIGVESFLDTVSNMYILLLKGSSSMGLLKLVMEKGRLLPSSFSLSSPFLSIYPSVSSIMIQKSVYINDKEELDRSITNIVNRMPIIDVHTHLFPPSHGSLMLWGFNEMLTYHYLVAEYFLVAQKKNEYDDFFKLPKLDQARLIWDQLFIKHSPVSEACRGVLTCLCELGLSELVRERDFEGIQQWFNNNHISLHIDKIFSLANVRYALMTNNPFIDSETLFWDDKGSVGEIPTCLKPALRVDAILKCKWKFISPTLSKYGFSSSAKGLRDFLLHFVKIIKPVYFMASVSPDFQYPPKDDDVEAKEILATLFEVSAECNLAFAFKFGCCRGVNPCLREAGDGVEIADVTPLRNLCSNFPNLKFLATFLSRVNQHEVCVLARKFRNLHIYGCWWFCNNPSIIKEITMMRIEMLGLSYTFQHSDARVLDQLLYKWRHSRNVLIQSLCDNYDVLFNSGWRITFQDIVDDVHRICGGSYEDFLSS